MSRIWLLWSYAVGKKRARVSLHPQTPGKKVCPSCSSKRIAPVPEWIARASWNIEGCTRFRRTYSPGASAGSVKDRNEGAEKTRKDRSEIRQQAGSPCCADVFGCHADARMPPYTFTEAVCGKPTSWEVGGTHAKEAITTFRRSCFGLLLPHGNGRNHTPVTCINSTLQG